MSGQRNILLTHQRGDKHINTDNFNNIVGKVNALSQFHFDGETTELVRVSGGARMVITRKSSGTGELWSLQHSKPANNQCTISAGRIVYGTKVYSVAEDTVVLEGATEFVFVKIIRASSVSSIEHASTYPVSNPTEFVLPLVEFTATNGVYDKGKILHKGDHVSTTPINTGGT
jgi:hypothetical protein